MDCFGVQQVFFWYLLRVHQYRVDFRLVQGTKEQNP